RAPLCPTVAGVVFTDGIAADLLDGWHADDLSSGAATPVASALLRLRCKAPGYDRFVAGGISALPRLSPGEARWRYLSLEPKKIVAPSTLPAWTIEGRLLREGVAPPD